MNLAIARAMETKIWKKTGGGGQCAGTTALTL
jgi:hypothetical protein